MSESGGEHARIKQIYNPESDPFLCTCGPCKRFWRDTFSESGDLLREPAICRSRETAILSAGSKVVKVGDRVIVQGRYPGTVKWVGVLHDESIAPELYVGVRLDDNVNSTHNGVYNGKRYFHVPRGHGAMVKYSEVTPIKAPDKKPPLSGNYMFPSWEEVRQRRKERNQRLQTIYASAGMSGPQFIEPYASPKLPALNSRRPSATKSLRHEPIIHIGDPHDIALKDMARKSQMDMKRTAVIKEDQEQKEMEKLRQHFAGGPDAERLAMTLKKLKSAYKEGKALLKRRHTRDLDDSYSNISDE